MRSVLISIQPKWCKKIVNGKKTVEIRKTRPKLETPFKCYIYESSGNSRVGNQNFNVLIKGQGRKKIIGEFMCNKIVFLGNISTDPWEYLMGDVHERHKKIVTEQACLSEEELLAYGGKYAWHISDLVVYDKPKELSEFYRKCVKMPCEGCEHLKYQRVNASEYDFDCEYLGYKIPISRSPQSWCYVEKLKGGVHE